MRSSLVGLEDPLKNLANSHKTRQSWPVRSNWPNLSTVQKSGLDLDESVEFTEYIFNMVPIKIVSRLKSKIDAQNTKYNLLIWMIGAGIAILSVVIALGD
ncbi:MAG: hypothetical protein OXE59_00485 [Bacteroidetes bacterium]|nr:hypothetical protein [Bacteroidota bacterium]